MDNYTTVETDEGYYAFSNEIIRRIVYDEAFYRTKHDSAKRVDVDGGWFEPDTYHYDFDYKKAKAEARSAAVKVGAQNRWLVESTGVQGHTIRSFKQSLKGLEIRARFYKRKSIALVEKAHAASLKNIYGTTANLEVGLGALKFVRDTSADTFVVCAGLLSGGAAYAAVGAGGIAKGVFKYQDTENIGAAVLETTVSFTVGVLGVAGKAAKGAEKVAVVLVGETVDAAGGMAVGLVEGKTVVDAAISVGAGKVVGVGVKGLARPLKLDQLEGFKELVGNTAIPARVRLQTPVPSRVAAKIGASAVLDNAGKAASERISSSISEALNSNAVEARQQVIRAPSGEPALADIAIVGPLPST